MANTISKLSIQITGNARGLNQALGRAANSVRGFAGRISTVLGNVPVIGQLTSNLEGLSGAFARSGSAAGRWGIAIGAAAAAAGLVGRQVMIAAGEIDRLAKTARTIGETPTFLEGFRLLASEVSGMDPDQATVALQRMTKRLAQVATEGGGEAAKTLERLGLSAERLHGQLPREALIDLSMALATVENRGERLLATMKVFGDEAKQLSLIFDEVAAGGLVEREEFAIEKGLAGTSEAVETMNDQLGRAKLIWSGWWRNLTRAAAEATTSFDKIVAGYNKVARAFKWMPWFWAQNRYLKAKETRDAEVRMAQAAERAAAAARRQVDSKAELTHAAEQQAAAEEKAVETMDDYAAASFRATFNLERLAERAGRLQETVAELREPIDLTMSMPRVGAAGARDIRTAGGQAAIGNAIAAMKNHMMQAVELAKREAELNAERNKRLSDAVRELGIIREEMSRGVMLSLVGIPS